MKKYLFTIFSIFVPALLFGQKETDAYQTILNIAYYQEAEWTSNAYKKERCRLDLYYPKGKTGFSTVVWFHGGGLSGGEKQIPEALKEKGIAVVAVNYRLLPNATVQECIEDAAAATSWALNHIQTYGGDSSSIFLAGHSAGGYLALMVGLDKKWLATHGQDANLLAGIIPFSGHIITHFALREKRGIPNYQPVIDEFAPLFHVRKDAPPLLLITGDRELELLGRYEENAYLYRMMKVAGHTNTRLYELDGYNHGMEEPAFPLLIKEVKSRE